MKKPEGATRAEAFRILLIDGTRNGLIARKSILEEHGFSVTALSSSEDALSKLQQFAFDLVITEYSMPKLSGPEIIRTVRETRPGTPVILISGLVDALGLCEKSTGADAVIPKSATEVSHLLRAVNRLLRPTAPRKPPSTQGVKRTLRRSAK
jgi:CheY-like chemotaxis protein